MLKLSFSGLRSKVVIKKPVRPVSGKEGEKDISTCTTSVGARFDKSVEKKSEPKPSKPKRRRSTQPSQVPVPFPYCLEERKKKESEEFLSFLNMFKVLKVNLPLLEPLEKMPKYVKFLQKAMSRRKKFGK